MPKKVGAFTIIELLAVIAIIGLLAALVLPSLSKARASSRAVVCLTHLKEFGAGWQLYSDDNDDVLVPARMGELPGGTDNRLNFYQVGNGEKYRPRWAALLGAQIEVFAFSNTDINNEQTRRNERLDYAAPVYQCPSELTWVDEQNYAYGYNYQFMGNARITSGRFHNFPIKRHRIKAGSGTVVAADSMGTAAGFIKNQRGTYENDGNNYSAMANFGFVLDPPRLTPDSDRGSGEADSPRTAVDPRHAGKANAVFADNHAEPLAPKDLGYRQNARDAFVNAPTLDAEEGGGGAATASAFTPTPGRDEASISLGANPADRIDWAHNRLFSGTGLDKDPPRIPLPQ